MNYELDYLLGKASIRTESVPRMVAENKVYSPRNPAATFATTYFWRMFLREREIKGKENLKAAVHAYSPKEPLTFAGPHKSDIDTQFVEQALRFEGSWRFANRLAYIAGLNMNERGYIKINTLGGNRIFVETPLIMDDLKEVLNSDREISEDDRLLLQGFMGVGARLNYNAGEEVIRARRRGQPIFVYPESTRSSDGFIKKAHPDTNTFFTKGIVLPTMIRGSEKFLPPKKVPPVHKWIFPGGVVDLEYGVPFYARTIQTPEVKAGLKELGATPVDLVMARISRMDWDRVDPRFRSWYQQLDQRFPTIPLAA